MSNTTCRPHGIAKRALALLTAIALATALTPSFALAEEANIGINHSRTKPHSRQRKQPFHG